MVADQPEEALRVAGTSRMSSEASPLAHRLLYNLTGDASDPRWEETPQRMPWLEHRAEQVGGEDTA